MRFLMIGFLRPGVERVSQEVQLGTNDFLGQPLLDIATAGELKDEHGRRAGMMIIIDCADRAEAETYLENSPYAKAQLYDEIRIFEYDAEVGRL